MKDIYKNPILYYIAVPLVVGLWPLLVWAIYLPAAQEDIKDQREQYKRADAIMMEILTLDPERLEFADVNDTAAEFSYGGAVDGVASICGIPASNYKVGTMMIIATREQKSQSGTVDLRQVDMVKFARFLSMIQLRWPSLQCERVKLTQKEGPPDVWDINIEFKYYY
jgi:hypothetical protein